MVKPIIIGTAWRSTAYLQMHQACHALGHLHKGEHHAEGRKEEISCSDPHAIWSNGLLPRTMKFRRR